MKLTNRIFMDDGLFQKEKQAIFVPSWNFIGLSNNLENEKSYFISQICETRIFAQKNKERIEVFSNSCPHRMHPLRKNATGRGPIVCPYHGWSFDYDGKLKKIPYHDECYQFKNKDFKLQKFPLKKVGKLLFASIKLKKNSHLFSSALERELSDLSNSFSDVIKKSYVRNFNWKLIIENLKDGLHPLFIHQETLNKNVNVGLPGIPRDIPATFLMQRHMSYGGPDVEVKDCLLNKFEHLFEDKIQNKRYLNYHIFPNVHIASPDGGLSFVIEHYKPISVRSTLIDVYYIFTKNDLDDETKKNLFKKFISDAEKVYEEDFSVLENIQSNLPKEISTQTNLGKHERMISRFYRFYFKKIYGTYYLCNNLFQEIKSVINLIFNQ